MIIRATLTLTGILLITTLLAQTTTMTTTGDWSNSANWDNGIPTSSTYARLQGTFGDRITCTVDNNAQCDSLSLFLASIIINSGVTLTINGGYSATTIGTNVNNGILIIKKSLTPAIGDGGLNIGGSVTSFSGLAFQNFTID